MPIDEQDFIKLQNEYLSNKVLEINEVNNLPNLYSTYWPIIRDYGKTPIYWLKHGIVYLHYTFKIDDGFTKKLIQIDTNLIPNPLLLLKACNYQC